MGVELRPKVGIGILIFNEKKQLLLGQRNSELGEGAYGPPGGHLEFGESFEECAIRETKEEAGIKIYSPEFLDVTNDIFIDDNKHYISIFMHVMLPRGQKVENLEPHKNLGWEWFDTDKLPSKLFLPLQNLIDSGKFKGELF